MTNTKYIRKLYRQTLKEKWDLPIEDMDIFSYCSFCIDKREKSGGYCATNGNGCADNCLIDKNICGSKGSLVDLLGDFYDKKLSYDDEIYPPEYVEMIENIRKALRKHAKVGFLSKLRAKL